MKWVSALSRDSHCHAAVSAASAETLNARINTVSDGLERFSDRGLSDATALINETRRSVSRIERAISDLERNPQRLIFGGDGDVKTYNGRQRR